MIHFNEATYRDPQGSPSCIFTLSFQADPHATNGETALDNAQAFVERVKLLVATPLTDGILARGSGGGLLTVDEMQRLILSTIEAQKPLKRAPQGKRPRRKTKKAKLR